MLFNSYTSVSRLINKEHSELLRLRLSEPIASESVGVICKSATNTKNNGTSSILCANHKGSKTCTSIQFLESTEFDFFEKYYIVLARDLFGMRVEE